jgi:hypothetical protein
MAYSGTKVSTFAEDLCVFFKSVDEYRDWKHCQPKRKLNDWIKTVFIPLITDEFVTKIVNELNNNHTFRDTVHEEIGCDNDNYYGDTNTIINSSIHREIRLLGREFSQNTGSVKWDIGIQIVYNIHHNPSELICKIREQIYKRFLLTENGFTNLTGLYN